MDVKVISPEIPMILEADVLRATEGSNHSTEINASRVLEYSGGMRTARFCESNGV